MEPIKILSAKPLELPEGLIPTELEPHLHSQLSGEDRKSQAWIIRLFCLLDIHKEEDFSKFVKVSIDKLGMYHELIPEKTITLLSEAGENVPLKLWQIELEASAEEMEYCRIAHVVVKTKTRKKRATTIAQTAAGE